MWDGQINRNALVDFFGISVPQASLDLARYIKMAPANIEYDPSAKVYRATRSFAPRVTRTDSKSFLHILLGGEASQELSDRSFLGWRPPYDVVQVPGRIVSPPALAAVTKAIRDRQDLDLKYQSLRRSSLTRRWIAPHALAYDGVRWHIRAWCHEERQFRDFVLTRVQDVYGSRTSEVDPTSDLQWTTPAMIILRPRSGLSRRQHEAVSAEYGMKRGMLRIQTREALVFYFARQLRLLESSDHPGEQPLDWVNRDQFIHLLQAGRK